MVARFANAMPVVLNGPIAQNRGHPNRGGSKVAKIVQLVSHSLQISAVEKVRVSWIKSSLIRIGPGRTSGVIGWIAIIKPIREKKVDDLAQARRSNARLKKTIISPADPRS